MSNSTVDSTVQNTTTEPLSFEKVWAMCMELREEIKETSHQIKETDRLVKETSLQMKETDRQMKETDRRMKETDKRIGDLGNRFGELAEHLVAPSIIEKFNELGFHFTRTSRDSEIKEDNNPKVFAEIDILLENGDFVIAVEVKAKPKDSDIDDHVRRMEILRRDADRRSDKRKYRGAIAGAIMSDSVRAHAFNTGFYVIEQTGDTVKISIPEDFIPREW